MGAIVDRSLAVAYLRHALRAIAPGDAADLLSVVLAGAEGRDRASMHLHLLASIALSGPGEAGLRDAIAAEARARGQADLAALVSASVEPPEDRALVVPDFGRGRPLTLGERKSLARRRDRNLLARVLRDPHPDVIGIVLANPAIVERDVVALCARRPIVPDVLREVTRSVRWMVRPAVRVALAKNPHTPLDVALRLVPSLDAVARREIAGMGELHEELRTACRGRAPLARAALH